MIIDAILNLFFGFCSFLINLLPSIASLPDWFNSFCSLCRIGLFFFPVDVWTVLIADFSFCTFSLIAVAFIEWIYKKIPGVN